VRTYRTVFGRRAGPPRRAKAGYGVILHVECGELNNYLEVALGRTSPEAATTGLNGST
jgi:hypothetical protein